MRHLLITYLLLYHMSVLHAQDTTGRSPINNRLLQFSDFKGKHQRDTAAAVIFTDINWYPKQLPKTGQQPNYNADVYMYPYESTVKPSWLQTAEDSIKQRVLHHEQGHYNISRIGALELNYMLKRFVFDEKRAIQQADSMRNIIVWRVTKLQKLYDKQSNHSRNHYWQQAWDVCIAQGLKLRTLRVFPEL
ncbi:MAG TPA: hypothetical protein VK167_05230 [Flavipsychrobacter sp.]|nr:hypothetical protein [Flavipsychrobacter sp.]